MSRPLRHLYLKDALAASFFFAPALALWPPFRLRLGGRR